MNVVIADYFNPPLPQPMLIAMKRIPHAWRPHCTGGEGEYVELQNCRVIALGRFQEY